MWERLERREINQRASTAATTTMSRRPRPGRPGLPYARPGYLCTKTHDHTSVLKLVEEKWNLPPLTRRDAAAQSPLDALDLDAAPAFRTPPDLPKPMLSWGSWTP
jgi:phospholipase C